MDRKVGWRLATSQDERKARERAACSEKRRMDVGVLDFTTSHDTKGARKGSKAKERKGEICCGTRIDSHARATRVYEQIGIGGRDWEKKGLECLRNGQKERKRKSKHRLHILVSISSLVAKTKKVEKDLKREGKEGERNRILRLEKGHTKRKRNHENKRMPTQCKTFGS